MTDVFELGALSQHPDPPTVAGVSLKRLLGTRLLVQAQSGAGKSWFLRKLLEETHGRVQHLVIDPEGEFATLRQRYDYVIAAKQGGDTLASPRTASLLATRLLELGANAILDLYELQRHDRTKFVRLFLEALNDAPKKLWHPVLVVLDEAHVFCPQQGEAESASAVIDLATRGRKRGFCLVAATQRLSKMDKDAVAELGNKMIGRTTLDVDLKRAADEIGMGKDRWSEIQSLASGEFFSYGPAFCHPGVKIIGVGDVKTEHPASGSSKAAATPPPTDKIRELLPKISDLPAEVEKKAQTEADLRKEIAELRGQLGAKWAEPVEDPRLPKALELLKQCREVLALSHRSVGMLASLDAIESGFNALRDNVRDQKPDDDQRAMVAHDLGLFLNGAPKPTMGGRIRAAVADRVVTNPKTGTIIGLRGTPAVHTDGSIESLTPGQQRILRTIANLTLRNLDPSREMVARWMAIHPNGGRYGQDLGALRASGWMEDFELRRAVQPTEAATRTNARAALKDGGQQRIFDALNHGPRVTYTRESLAAHMGLHPNGGRYGQDLGWLRTMGLIPERGEIYLTEAAGYPGT